MATVHISEADAVRDFAGVLARVRAGQEIVIDADDSPVAVLMPAVRSKGRLFSESLRIAIGASNTQGDVSMNPDFAADLEEIVRSRAPRSSAWD